MLLLDTVMMAEIEMNVQAVRFSIIFNRNIFIFEPQTLLYLEYLRRFYIIQ